MNAEKIRQTVRFIRMNNTSKVSECFGLFMSVLCMCVCVFSVDGTHMYTCMCV